MSAERRLAARTRFANGVLPPAARLHPGRDVIVVDLSRYGALVEGVWRLRPGGRVELQIEIERRTRSIAGRVERCYVAALTAGGVRYRAAIRFEGAIGFEPPRDLLDGYSVPGGRVDGPGSPGQSLPAERGSTGSGV